MVARAASRATRKAAMRTERSTSATGAPGFGVQVTTSSVRSPHAVIDLPGPAMSTKAVGKRLRGSQP